jgi:hypothetical protein
VASKALLEEPTRNELSALIYECFPPMEESRVIITEYSENALRTSEYTLEEVLASECILQPGDLVPRVRWIYVEYYKMGTFWGSDYRFSQWGTDPALFEKSPIVLLQDRLAELDRKAGRRPLEEEDIPGKQRKLNCYVSVLINIFIYIDHKRIGKYYRQTPGCPEYLGLRVKASTWLKTEPYELLLNFLALRPGLCKELQRYQLTDLQYGLAYINAVQCIRNSAYDAKPGLLELHNIANMENVYLYGSWDDNVERLEFYREHTLLSCGSPRFCKVVANRLLRKEDVLRQHPDCALLYYTLARISIENDEMMQDAPERALNKVFARLKNNRSASRQHVEIIFSLQQAVLEGLEYLEENKRELPIWGIPPFDNHQVCFHPNHTPPPRIRDLIQDEMDLVDKDFDKAIGHWESLRSKVDRYLEVLLQFRVLEQQELSVSQSHLATQQRSLAIDEARSSRVQSRSVIVFTAITIIFLPLSFFTSYFGMNFTDIVRTAHSSKYFWMIAGPVSGINILVIFVIMKFLSVVKDPVLDEESALARSEAAESKVTWRSRLGLGKGKIKNS